jgi:hypothetical protein
MIMCLYVLVCKIEDISLAPSGAELPMGSTIVLQYSALRMELRKRKVSIFGMFCALGPMTQAYSIQCKFEHITATLYVVPHDSDIDSSCFVFRDHLA